MRQAPCGSGAARAKAPNVWAAPCARRGSPSVHGLYIQTKPAMNTVTNNAIEYPKISALHLHSAHICTSLVVCTLCPSVIFSGARAYLFLIAKNARTREIKQSRNNAPTQSSKSSIKIRFRLMLASFSVNSDARKSIPLRFPGLFSTSCRFGSHGYVHFV